MRLVESSHWPHLRPTRPPPAGSPAPVRRATLDRLDGEIEPMPFGMMRMTRTGRGFLRGDEGIVEGLGRQSIRISVFDQFLLRFHTYGWLVLECLWFISRSTWGSTCGMCFPGTSK